MVKKYLKDIDDEKVTEIQPISLYDALYNAVHAWKLVNYETIYNCFRHSDLYYYENDQLTQQEIKNLMMIDYDRDVSTYCKLGGDLDDQAIVDFIN